MAEAAAAPVRAARALGPRGLGPRKAGAQHTVPQAPGGLPGQTGPAGPGAAASGREVRRGLPDRVEPGTAVRAPEADPRQVPGLRVPGPGSFLGAGPVLPSPSSPSSPSGLVAPGRCPTSIPHTLSTHYVPGPPRAARGLLPFVQPGWRCAQPGLGMISVLTANLWDSYYYSYYFVQERSWRSSEVNLPRISERKCGKTVLTVQ